MKKTIDIDIQIDAACSDPQIIIRTSRMTPEIEHIVEAIEDSVDSDYPMISAFDGDAMVLLSQREIIRVFLERRKLILQTERGRFVMRKTLSEMETRLNRKRFLRISRSEIINLNRVSHFDCSLSGTMQVQFDDGTSTWVARRYVKRVRDALRML